MVVDFLLNDMVFYRRNREYITANQIRDVSTIILTINFFLDCYDTLSFQDILVSLNQVISFSLIDEEWIIEMKRRHEHVHYLLPYTSTHWFFWSLAIFSILLIFLLWDILIKLCCFWIIFRCHLPWNHSRVMNSATICVDKR